MNLPRLLGYIFMFMMGSFFFVCATWFREFPPYKFLIKRFIPHVVYQIFGIVILVALALLLLGVLKPVI